MKSSCKWPACSCRSTGIYCKDKPAGGPKPRKRIAPISAKEKIKKELTKMVVHNDARFYLEIWEERTHTNFESGLPIFGGFMLWYFHHVLPKRPDGGYPQYRYCKWNIVLVDKPTHDQAEADMDKTPRIKEYYHKLLALHNSGELQHISPDIHQL